MIIFRFAQVLFCGVTSESTILKEVTRMQQAKFGNAKPAGHSHPSSDHKYPLRLCWALLSPLSDIFFCFHIYLIRYFSTYSVYVVVRSFSLSKRVSIFSVQQNDSSYPDRSSFIASRYFLFNF